MEKKFRSIMVQNIVRVGLIIRTLFLIPHGVCKYHPSCTVYAKRALNKLPLHKAIFAIVKRVLRCNPFSRGGFDPL